MTLNLAHALDVHKHTTLFDTHHAGANAGQQAVWGSWAAMPGPSGRRWQRRVPPSARRLQRWTGLATPATAAAAASTTCRTSARMGRRLLRGRQRRSCRRFTLHIHRSLACQARPLPLVCRTQPQSRNSNNSGSSSSSSSGGFCCAVSQGWARQTAPKQQQPAAWQAEACQHFGDSSQTCFCPWRRRQLPRRSSQPPTHLCAAATGLADSRRDRGEALGTAVGQTVLSPIVPVHKHTAGVYRGCAASLLPSFHAAMCQEHAAGVSRLHFAASAAWPRPCTTHSLRCTVAVSQADQLQLFDDSDGEELASPPAAPPPAIAAAPPATAAAAPLPAAAALAQPPARPSGAAGSTEAAAVPSVAVSARAPVLAAGVALLKAGAAAAAELQPSMPPLVVNAGLAAALAALPQLAPVARSGPASLVPQQPGPPAVRSSAMQPAAAAASNALAAGGRRLASAAEQQLSDLSSCVGPLILEYPTRAAAQSTARFAARCCWFAGTTP